MTERPAADWLDGDVPEEELAAGEAAIEKWPGGIIGAPLVMVRPDVATHRGRVGVLFQPAAHLRHGTDGGSAYLPGFGPGEDHGPATAGLRAMGAARTPMAKVGPDSGVV